MTIVLDPACGFLAKRLRGSSVFVESGKPRTVSDKAATELRRALRAESVSGPYLLVGSSFSGLTALLYAYRFPEEVAGVLLLDSSHPRQTEVALSALSEDLSDDPEITSFRRHLKGFGLDWDQSCRLFDDLGSLGDLCLIALAAEHPPMPGSLPEAVRSRLTKDWHALQRDHARRSARGEMRVVAGSGHEIANDAPEVVLQTIEEMIDEIEQMPNQSVISPPDSRSAPSGRVSP